VVRDLNTTRPVRVMPVTLWRLPPVQAQVTTRPRRTEVKVGEKKLLPTRTDAAAARGFAAPASNAHIGVATLATSNAAATAATRRRCADDLNRAIRVLEHAREANLTRRMRRDSSIAYLRTNAGWQVMVVPHETVILEASRQPGTLCRQPRKLESVAGRASSLTIVPTGKNASQLPALSSGPRKAILVGSCNPSTAVLSESCGSSRVGAPDAAGANALAPPTSIESATITRERPRRTRAKSFISSLLPAAVSLASDPLRFRASPVIRAIRPDGLHDIDVRLAAVGLRS
jgi:hypothetical protein